MILRFISKVMKMSIAMMVLCCILFLSCAKLDFDHDRNRLVFNEPAVQVKDSINALNSYNNVIKSYRIDLSDKSLYFDTISYGILDSTVDINKISSKFNIDNVESARMVRLINYLYKNKITGCFAGENTKYLLYRFKELPPGSFFSKQKDLQMFIFVLKDEQQDVRTLFDKDCTVYDIKDSLILCGRREFSKKFDNKEPFDARKWF